MEDPKLQKNVKDFIKSLGEEAHPEEDRNKFIAWLYSAGAERKNIVTFIPFANSPVLVKVGSLVLLFAAVSYFLFTPLNPSVQGVKGTVKIYNARKGEWSLAKADNLRLRKDDRLKTFAGSQADLLLSGLYHIRLKENSEIRLAGTPTRIIRRKALYNLSKGKVFANCAKKGRNFEIETEDATISVVGTDFMVSSAPAVNRTWVGVLDGIVEVAGRNIPAKLKAADFRVAVKPGEKTVVQAGKAPAAPTMLMENELLEMEELYSIGRKPQVALLISTGGLRTRELLSITPLYTYSEKPGILPEQMTAIIDSFNEALKEGRKELFLENVKQFEDLVKEYPNPKYDVQFLLFIAAYYAHLEEYDKSIATFRRITDNYPDSNLASIAQCAIGIIYEEKLHDSQKAREAYKKVLSDYPLSPEREEAQAGLQRLASS